MNGKKRLLTAGVVAVLVVCAVPALAWAAVWKDKGTNVTKAIEFAAVGGELWEVIKKEGEVEKKGGMSCEVRLTFATSGGTTGEVTKFENIKCPTAFGTFAGCELSSATGKSLPWIVHVNATDLTITNLKIKRTFKAGCPTSELEKTISEATVTLESTTAIDTMNVEGSATEYTAHSTLKVEGANNGTYGIG